MIRESLFYKILSAIHIVFFTSLLCGITILLSGTLLLLPVLGAAFVIGKDAIYKDLNINDSIIKTYFVYLKKAMTLIRFIPIQIVLLLNVAGMILAGNAEYLTYSVICLTLASFLFVFQMYIAGYYAFINRQVNVMEAAICMLYKLQLMIPIFAVIVVCGVFFSGIMVIILLLTGSFFLFALEVIIFIQTLYFRKLTNTLDENDDYAYLVTGKARKN